MNQIKKYLPALVLGAFFFPLTMSAATPLEDFVVVLANVVKALVPIASTLAVVYFFYGLARFILAAGDPQGKVEGKNIMIWGVVAIFIMLSIFGIVGFIQQTVGTDEKVDPQIINLPRVIP